MHRFSKFALLALLVLFVLFLFRKQLWQSVASYEDIQSIALQSLTDNALKEKIRTETQGMNGKEIIAYCRNLTCDCLTFSMFHAECDVNRMYPQSKTHCVGYAAFFASTCKYAFYINRIDGRLSHKRGRMHILGMDVHKPFSNVASLKDHDYVLVNLDGEVFTVDPSIEDFLSL